jgi:hypothetical protein
VRILPIFIRIAIFVRVGPPDDRVDRQTGTKVPGLVKVPFTVL